MGGTRCDEIYLGVAIVPRTGWFAALRFCATGQLAVFWPIFFT